MAKLIRINIERVKGKPVRRLVIEDHDWMDNGAARRIVVELTKQNERDLLASLLESLAIR